MGQTDGQTGEETNGQTEEETDGQTEEETDGQQHNFLSIHRKELMKWNLEIIKCCDQS